MSLPFRWNLRTRAGTQLVMVVLSLVMIITALFLQATYGQITDPGASVCTVEPSGGAISSCIYPGNYAFSKTVQAFAPGAFTAGLVGILIALLLTGLSQPSRTATIPDPQPKTGGQQPENDDRFRRPR
ncbi:hypothetical protein B7R22_17965 [Subtercola boreus]|uniref:Vitamin K epoxide reductase domain-containing protein n=1 Tax=Subtercola boreus TaxID=120213 RepID=A0A3E0VSB1_9MICO|nr:hypothetical protein B7R22_17965 [Subtercola boreus]